MQGYSFIAPPVLFSDNIFALSKKKPNGATLPSTLMVSEHVQPCWVLFKEGPVSTIIVIDSQLLHHA